MTYEQCLGLSGEKWSSLEDSEKIEVLQTIENRMAFESGRLPCPVVGQWLYTGEDGIVLGLYRRDTQTIYINTSQFDPESKYGKDPDRIITTCIHEGRHAYQNQVANGLITHEDAEEAEAWRDNLAEDNYISYQENPVAYYMQPVEVDARSFAEDRMMYLQEERSNLIQHTNQESTAKTVFEQQMSSTDNISSDAAYVEMNTQAISSGECIQGGNGYSM